MDPSQLIPLLTELAEDLGLRVRMAPRDGGVHAEVPPQSGRCVVRGEQWIILSAADPPGLRLELLARSLREDFGAKLEERYLPPAVRRALERR